ncbi:hypothetical protein N9850_06320 [Granulosicoccus sp.]|nr:hypothetical protein [Granulosicoccus sp.]MDB4223368.1 hypothetical protein [Granulosicoccus sp.]
MENKLDKHNSDSVDTTELKRNDGSRRSSLEKYMLFLIDEFDGYIILASMALAVIAGIMGWDNIIKAAAITLLGAMAFRIFRLRYDISNFTESVNLKSDRVIKNQNDRTNDIKSDIDDLRNSIVTERIHEAEICDRPSFYLHMLDALQRARHTVDLTMFDQYAPKYIGTPEMVQYFELQSRMVQEKPNITFRRIVAIPTLEKLEWVLDVLEETSDCPNFQINVIDLDGTNALPAPLSFQIFDNKEFCLVDPTLGEMIPTPQPKMLWVRGAAATQAFSYYYDAVWSRSQKLKSGPLIHWTVLESLLAKLSNRSKNSEILKESIQLKINRMQGD